MEYLVMMQPAFSELGFSAFVVGFFSAILLIVSYWLSMRNQGNIIISPKEYASIHEDIKRHPSIYDDTKIHKLWENYATGTGFKVLAKYSKRVCVVSLSIYLFCIVPALSKEMFKNTVIYQTVTSDTTAHAIQTLDKLLDTIDAKLDGVVGE